MLRDVKTFHLQRRLTILGWRYELFVRRPKAGEAVARWHSGAYKEMHGTQAVRPVAVADLDERRYWLFEERLYWEDDGLTGQDVLALVRERQRSSRRRLDRAHAGLAASDDGRPRREPIPRDVRVAVFDRDGGRCVQCESNFDLQYDHVIPVSLGGASTVENLQILCADCNRAKGDLL